VFCAGVFVGDKFCFQQGNYGCFLLVVFVTLAGFCMVVEGNPSGKGFVSWRDLVEAAVSGCFGHC
jgi:hypothetical protein